LIERPLRIIPRPSEIELQADQINLRIQKQLIPIVSDELFQAMNEYDDEKLSPRNRKYIDTITDDDRSNDED
jgi:hypothetical protein